MKPSAVEWLYDELEISGGYESTIEILRQAKEIERQNMLDIITIYHNNLFYIPLKDGENKQILEMILNGTITNK
jgi:hypothetical protein